MTLQGYPYVGLVALTFVSEPTVTFTTTPENSLGEGRVGCHGCNKKLRWCTAQPPRMPYIACLLVGRSTGRRGDLLFAALRE